MQDLYHFSLIITSREISYLALNFYQSRYMKLRANSRDVRKYIESYIRNLSKCIEKNASLQETIANIIVNSVDEM